MPGKSGLKELALMKEELIRVADKRDVGASLFIWLNEVDPYLMKTLLHENSNQ